MAKEADKNKKVRKPSALKRDIQDQKSRLRNRAFKASVRSAIRQFEGTLEKGDVTAAKAGLNEVYSIMDKGVKKGVFKANKASRTKARLAARVHQKVSA